MLFGENDAVVSVEKVIPLMMMVDPMEVWGVAVSMAVPVEV